MRYIVIPPPLEQVAAYTLAQCIGFIVDNDAQFAHPATRIRMGQRILTALETERAYLVLKDDDWEALNNAFQSPSAGYGSFRVTRREGDVDVDIGPARVAPRSFLPFIDAIGEALNTEPALAATP